MSAQPLEVSDELRAHLSELGTRAVQARRRRKRVVEDIVTATRKAQALPGTVADIEVLERVAALIEEASHGAHS
jgi:hypothetical protein